MGPGQEREDGQGLPEEEWGLRGCLGSLDGAGPAHSLLYLPVESCHQPQITWKMRSGWPAGDSLFVPGSLGCALLLPPWGAEGLTWGCCPKAGGNWAGRGPSLTPPSPPPWPIHGGILGNQGLRTGVPRTGGLGTVVQRALPCSPSSPGVMWKVGRGGLCSAGDICPQLRAGNRPGHQAPG